MADSTEQDKTPHAENAPSPGGRLRAARERKGLTLQEAADALRLDHWLVEALERDEFDVFGGPVFVKGHLRRYATLTGEPVDDILFAYHQRGGEQEVQQLLDRTALLSPVSSPSRGLPTGALLALLVVAGAGAAWWWYEQPVERPAPVGSIAVASIETERAGADTLEQGTGSSFDTFASTPAMPAAESAAQPGDGALSATAMNAADASAVTPPPVAPVTDASTPAADATTAATGAGATPAAEPAIAASPPSEPGVQATEAMPLRAGEHLIVLTFTGESWAEVHDGAGTRLYYDLGQPGSRRTLRGVPPFQIYLGDYVDVNIEVDGRPQPIPAESVRGNTARFTLDPT